MALVRLLPYVENIWFLSSASSLGVRINSTIVKNKTKGSITQACDIPAAAVLQPLSLRGAQLNLLCILSKPIITLMIYRGANSPTPLNLLIGQSRLHSDRQHRSSCHHTPAASLIRFRTTLTWNPKSAHAQQGILISGSKGARLRSALQAVVAARLGVAIPAATFGLPGRACTHPAKMSARCSRTTVAGRLWRDDSGGTTVAGRQWRCRRGCNAPQELIAGYMITMALASAHSLKPAWCEMPS